MNSVKKTYTMFTIGYEGLNIIEFLAWMKKHGIDVVVDVRNKPISRKKGFSKLALNESLEKDHISYIGFPELGTTKDMRDDLYQTGNYKDFFSLVEDRLSENQEALKNIIRLIKSGKRIVLLCFEKDPYKCHRKIVAEAIRKMYDKMISIQHIVPL